MSAVTGTAPVLEVAGLEVGLGRGRHRVSVLEEISFSVAAGECVAVVGASGAGKSVLARALLGLVQAEPGWSVASDRLIVNGLELQKASQRAWRAVRGDAIGLVLQDALQSLDPLRTIGDEVGETLAIRGVLRGERRSRVVTALTEAGLPGAADRLRQRSPELSGGMRQRALIAAALSGDPAILIADEPTTALDPTTAARVLGLFAEIRDRGTGVLFISHDLRSVEQLADRILVIDNGRIVEAGATDDLLQRPQHRATRALVAATPNGPKPGPTARPGAPLLALSGASRQFATPTGDRAGIFGVDLDVRRGEAIGVVGESGAGKTTLARILAGAERLDTGLLERTDAAAQVRLIPQDPLATFDPRWRVRRIIETSVRADASGARRTAEELLAEVGLGAELLDRFPVTLSGGQRQRVAIARALAARPDMLVCDEPVSALDVATQAGILQLLSSLQRDHAVAIVFVSHDLAAVRTVCDRLIIMQHGEVVERGATEAVFANPQHPFTREMLALA
ncbi:ATP-binding cassette domain-containing protein [Leucobacter musarum]|uniref:ATP-binding cassette domain-containing protein n=1 Tax=Leucobacter musarum TaxID=1930747 RepID=UPI0006A7B939|nr:ABC transporter ATP-binding protein [Leucobacter musarum]